MTTKITLEIDPESYEDVKAKLTSLYEIADNIGERIEPIRNFRLYIDHYYAFFSFLTGVVIGAIGLWIILGHL